MVRARNISFNTVTMTRSGLRIPHCSSYRASGLNTEHDVWHPGTVEPWKRDLALAGPLAGTCTTLSHQPLTLRDQRTYSSLAKKHLEIPRIGRILPFSLTLLNVLPVEYRRNRAQHTCNPASVNKKALGRL